MNLDLVNVKDLHPQIQSNIHNKHVFCLEIQKLMLFGVIIFLGGNN